MRTAHSIPAPTPATRSVRHLVIGKAFRLSAKMAAAIAVVLSSSLATAGGNAKWGYLVGKDQANRIYSWQLAQALAEYLNDGNLKDNTIGIPVVSFWTQCYGGNWLAQFNGTPGQSVLGPGYDRWTFTSATTYAANQPDKLAYYGGYHAGASAAMLPAYFLQPFSPESSAFVHSVGIANRNPKETPVAEGDLTAPLVRGKTLFVTWAGQPEGPDFTDRDNVRAVADASGNEAVSAFGVLANRQELDLILKFDVAKLGKNDQLVIFGTDHGGYTEGWVQDLADPNAPQTWANGLTLNLNSDLFAVVGQNKPWLEIASLTPLTLVDIRRMGIAINGVALDLSSFAAGTSERPDGDDSLLYTYRLPFDPKIFMDRKPNGEGFDQFLSFGVSEKDKQRYQLAWVMVSPGDTAKLISTPIPEPGTWALMALGLAGLATVARRRPRTTTEKA